MIGFSAKKRYMKKYKSYKSAIIGPRFRSGNVQATAKQKNMFLIETETICKILYNYNISYTPAKIFEILFEGGEVMVTPEDVPSSLAERDEIIVHIIKDLFAIFENVVEKKSRRI